MSKIKVVIEFDCDGEVSPDALKANVEGAISRQMANTGLSGDDDEGLVEDFTVTVGEMLPKSTYLVDIPDPHNLSGSWVNVGESFETEAEAIAWAKEHLGADDQGNINVISEVEGEY